MTTPPARVCPVCQSPIGPQEERVQCADCETYYHAECWESNRGCAVYGCPQVPPTEKWDDTDIPAAFWGREQKPCPACGKEILAAALRCRHCGATFQSSRPESAEDFRQQQSLQRLEPDIKRAVLMIFVFNVITCAAPVAAVVGLVWCANHRRELEAMPAIYRTLARVGPVVGFVQTAALVGMTLLYGLFRS